MLACNPNTCRMEAGSVQGHLQLLHESRDPQKTPNEILSQFKHTKKNKILTIHSKSGLSKGVRKAQVNEAKSSLPDHHTPFPHVTTPQSSARSPRTARALNPDWSLRPSLSASGLPPPLRVVLLAVLELRGQAEDSGGGGA